MKNLISFAMLLAFMSVFKVSATEPVSSLTDKEKAEFLKVALQVCKDVDPTCDYSGYIPKFAGPKELAPKSAYTYTPQYEKNKSKLVTVYLYKDTADVTTYYEKAKKYITREAWPEIQVEVWYDGDMTPAGYKKTESELGHMFLPTYEEYLKTYVKK